MFARLSRSSLHDLQALQRCIATTLSQQYLFKEIIVSNNIATIPGFDVFVRPQTGDYSPLLVGEFTFNTGDESISLVLVDLAAYDVGEGEVSFTVIDTSTDLGGDSLEIEVVVPY